MQTMRISPALQIGLGRPGAGCSLAAMFDPTTGWERAQGTGAPNASACEETGCKESSAEFRDCTQFVCCLVGPGRAKCNMHSVTGLG